MFKTAAISDPSGVVATDDSQTSIVIGVSIVVSIAVLGFIAFALYLLMKRRKRYERKAPYPQFVPGLEDLIEMRRRSHSGGAEPRGHRDLLELGKLNACGCLSHDFYLTWVLICFFTSVVKGSQNELSEVKFIGKETQRPNSPTFHSTNQMRGSNLKERKYNLSTHGAPKSSQQHVQYVSSNWNKERGKPE